MNGMSSQRDPETVLAAWLDEGPTDLPGETRRAILAALPTTSQARRGPFAPWRLPMTGISRLATAAIVAVLAIVGAIYVIGPRFGVGGPVPNPTPTPQPTASARPTQVVADVGTITLTDTGCTWAGNPSRIEKSQFSLLARVTVINETDTFGNFGVYRLNDGVDWSVGADYITALNAALHGQATDPPPADFITDVGNIDAPLRQQYAGSFVVDDYGTYGIVCSSNEPPPGDVFATYLVGPLEVVEP